MATLPESMRLPNSVAFRQLLTNCGKLLVEPDPNVAQPTMGEVLDTAVKLYKAGVEDPAVQPAAFGMAVAMISTNLEVSVRSAALVLSTILDLRGK